MRQLLITLCALLSGTVIHAQCQNTTQWPQHDVVASPFNEEVLIANNNFPGDFAIIINIEGDNMYKFTSAVSTDFITVRTSDDLTVIDHGTTPLFATIPPGVTSVRVHFNSSSACQTSTVPRETNLTCMSCPAIPKNVIIGEPNTPTNLTVHGDVRLNNSIGAPVSGTVRFNDLTNDFEGYNGANWVSLTKTNGTYGQYVPQSIEPNTSQGSGVNPNSSFFGSHFDLQDDEVAIELPSSQLNSGKVEIFKKSNGIWEFDQLLYAPDSVCLLYTSPSPRD